MSLTNFCFGATHLFHQCWFGLIICSIMVPHGWKVWSLLFAMAKGQIARIQREVNMVYGYFGIIDVFDLMNIWRMDSKINLWGVEFGGAWE